MNAKCQRRLRLEPLEERRLLAVDFEVVRDINAVPIPEGSGADDFARAGEYLFFTAESPHGGKNLWRTDGTSTGTLPLSNQVLPKYSSVVEVDDTIFFTASGRDHGSQLWKSDGTPHGTTFVSELGFVSGVPIDRLFLSGDRLFATTRRQLWTYHLESGIAETLTGGLGYEVSATAVGNLTFLTSTSLASSGMKQLLVTDGTSTGTIALGEFGWIDETTAAPDHSSLLFSVDAGGGAYELWKSDGTHAGTQLIKQTERNGFGQGDFVLLQNEIYFTTSGPYHVDLWKTDGSPAGTNVVRSWSFSNEELDPDVFAIPVPSSLVNVHDTLYLTLRDDVRGNELWISDGTAAGTRVISDFVNPQVSVGLPSHLFPGGPLTVTTTTRAGGGFFPTNVSQTWQIHNGTVEPFGALQAARPEPSSFTPLGNSILFKGGDDTHGMELWRTDRNLSAASLVKDIHPGEIDGLWGFLPTIPLNGNLVLLADDGEHGQELWITDGTAGNTRMLRDLNGGTESSWPQDLLGLDGRLIFEARHDDFTTSIWSSDGSRSGTVQLSDPAEDATGLYELNDEFYFLSDGNLWKTDGTAAGTTLVKVPPWRGSSLFRTGFSDHDHRLAGNHIYLRTTTEIWISDGTANGTVAIGNLPECGANQLSPTGSHVFFAGDDCESGLELWATNLSSGTTELVRDLRPGELGSVDSYDSMATLGENLVFTAHVSQYGEELWVSDGTRAGTKLLRDIFPGPGSSRISSLMRVRDKLYFTATNGTDRELWQTDGTRAGTMRLRNGTKHLNPALLLFNDALFFWADDEQGRRQLWRTDGSNAVHLGNSNEHAFSEVTQHADVSSTMFFGCTSYALCKTDGTREGTGLVVDLLQGPDSSSPRVVGRADEVVYFTAQHGNDRVLWETDGTEAGTRRLNSGGPFAPREVTKVGDQLFAVAQHPELGVELWHGEDVELANPWQNPANRFDVDNDSVVSPLDALAIITELTERSFSDRATGELHSVNDSTRRYLDADGDGYLGPVDALLVIGELPSTTNRATASFSTRTPSSLALSAEEEARDLLFSSGEIPFGLEMLAAVERDDDG